MSFYKLVKPYHTQQYIGEFFACYQQNCVQIPLSNSPKNLKHNKFSLKHNFTLLKSILFKQSSKYPHNCLLQNISSFNDLKNQSQHDYSQFQGDGFVHVLKLGNQLLEDHDQNIFINDTQTVQSQYIMISQEETNWTENNYENSEFNESFISGSQCYENFQYVFNNSQE